ncbi:flagellar motor protein MotB [Sanguibacter hominis ATCC BAA-789]|uniref:Flagellar motor protein MotB n=1 Tax=Sanguibacter hominis ATCC BAA-789 TaxID=1312740 RepID=A0A9X5FEM0_9MICO|nr:flagellar motor protein MotB [Sanguibacter hominis]NKX93562.1 flagellar motor protein MotB [Sanguibacter hominis ATCC BAA-789]
MSRRRKRVEEEEHENHERWAVSYSDMMTVLMALFLVMYAISTVDQTKYEELAQSLSSGFGAGDSVVLVDKAGLMNEHGEVMNVKDINDIAPSISSGVVTGSFDGSEGEFSAQDYAEAEAEYDHLEEIRDHIEENLARVKLSDAVTFRITERGLVVGMITTDVFFDTASNELTKTSRKVIDAVGKPLRTINNEIAIEGHADIVPTGSTAKTNWELSSARATTVLRRMVEKSRLEPARMSAVGFGDARPLVDKTDTKSLAANRRADVVVLSDKPERIRELLTVVDENRKKKSSAVQDGEATAAAPASQQEKE